MEEVLEYKRDGKRWMWDLSLACRMCFGASYRDLLQGAETGLSVRRRWGRMRMMDLGGSAGREE